MYDVSHSGLEDWGGNTLMISYRAGGYGIEQVVVEHKVRREIWKLCWGGASWALEGRICQVDVLIFLCWNDISCMLW